MTAEEYIFGYGLVYLTIGYALFLLACCVLRDL
jgi:hypothetical protein